MAQQTQLPESGSTALTAADCRVQIDPRGPRFGGAITTVVIAIALIAQGTTLGTALVVWQTLVFALGALVGLQAQPYGILFRRLIRPRLAPPAELEDAAPPRYAQACGLAFTAVALVGGGRWCRSADRTSATSSVCTPFTQRRKPPSPRRRM